MTEPKKKGGAQPGAGRPKGSVSTRVKLGKEAIEAIAAQGVTPLEFLVKVMRDSKKSMDVRIDAAKAAAPYMHSRLGAIELTGSGGGPIQAITRIELVPLE